MPLYLVYLVEATFLNWLHHKGAHCIKLKTNVRGLSKAFVQLTFYVLVDHVKLVKSCSKYTGKVAHTF